MPEQVRHDEVGWRLSPQLRTLPWRRYSMQMARALISPDNSVLRNVAGVAVASVAIPIAIFVKLVVSSFEKPIERSPAEVLSLLRNFHDGTGDDYDWDDFVCVPIADTPLESIRERAAALILPADVNGLADLKLLIAEVAAIAQAECRSMTNGS